MLEDNAKTRYVSLGSLMRVLGQYKMSFRLLQRSEKRRVSSGRQHVLIMNLLLSRNTNKYNQIKSILTPLIVTTDDFFNFLLNLIFIIYLKLNRILKNELTRGARMQKALTKPTLAMSKRL